MCLIHFLFFHGCAVVGKLLSLGSGRVGWRGAREQLTCVATEPDVKRTDDLKIKMEGETGVSDA